MTGTVALVTGAGKGIGLEVARQLGRDGDTVLLGARDAQRGAAAAQSLAADGVAATVVPLDVTDPAAVRAAAEWIEATYGRLDVLVNNAGVNVEFPGREPGDLTPAELRATFETNVVGVVAVTNAVLPLLRRSPAGRVVNVSSELGLPEVAADPAAPSITAYSLSKASLNLLTVFYAKQLLGTGVTVNSCSPGFVRTDINHGAGFRSAAEGAADIVRVIRRADGTTGAFFTADGDRHPAFAGVAGRIDTLEDVHP